MVALFIALVLDAIDFFLVGAIPLLGDVVDIFGIIVLYLFVGKAALIGLFELIPIVGDLFPSFVTATVLSLALGRKR